MNSAIAANPTTVLNLSTLRDFVLHEISKGGKVTLTYLSEVLFNKKQFLSADFENFLSGYTKSKLSNPRSFEELVEILEIERIFNRLESLCACGYTDKNIIRSIFFTDKNWFTRPK